MTRAGRAYAALFLTALAMVIAIWLVGLDRRELGTVAGVLNALGRMTALIGTYLLMVQLVLRTHVPWLVSAFGKDALKSWHTTNAYVALGLIVAHVVLQTAGYALQDRVDLGREMGLLAGYSGMVLAAAGFVLLALLTLAGLERYRHRIAWPTWRALHLFMYAAVLLGIPHMFATGSDFIGAPVSVAYWTALELAVFAMLLVTRVPPIWRAATASGRPHPAIVIVGTLIFAAYLAGTARLAPEDVIAASSVVPRTAPPPAASAVAHATPAPVAGASLIVQGDEIDTPYGTLQVRVRLTDGRIADVEPVHMPAATKRSQTISNSVEPWLRKRAIDAQSADFEILSGATYTSRAYQTSLDSALRSVGTSTP